MAEKENQSTKSETALREERVLEFWKENKIFEKSLEQSEGKKEFIFYEGPPTANGKPGIHHLEARAFKDVIPRYKTMRGYHVRRKGGWDTHGLPVELQVEKKLGLNSKKGIEEYGIAKFNQECKESVWEYLEIWNKFTKRIGYWVDQENPYVTYHNEYIESVWNIVKKINEQNLLYKDYKVVPWCPRCGTALSSHELAQGYEDVKDLSVTVKFKIKGQDNTYILAWTTTPWTLPGNVALAVGEKIDYIKIKWQNEFLILAKERLPYIVTEGAYEVVENLKGSDLVNSEYEPLYPFLTNIIYENEKPKLEKAYKVYPADFVTTEDGTGVVHTAVMYGQDDFALGNEIGLPKQHLVGLDGKFLSGTGIFEGRFVRDEDVAVDVIRDLAQRGFLLKKEKYEHSYPHCWRCHTALIYYARDSWYIRVTDPKIKERMITENKEIKWEPAHLREGRFGEWLREIKDWAISRERYWGTPLPVWHCEKCKKIEVIGSLKDLEKKAVKNKNKYFIVRHGEAENNTKFIVDSGEREFHLTEAGREKIASVAENLKSQNIDVIISSDILRTKETAELISKPLGLEAKLDSRLRELHFGVFAGKTDKEWREFSKDYSAIWDKKHADTETLREMRNRLWGFVEELEKTYKNKNILLITHEYGAWFLKAALEGWNKEKIIREKIASGQDFVGRGEIFSGYFKNVPRNSEGEIDLHRPYIDDLPLVCGCGGKLNRVKEVMDVWFDSGAMPFAQDHYPFENKDWVDGEGYPADFISEAIDQTRGWFYTLHAVGALMGRGKAYKNVICLGHLLDAKGKKMSKSIGNVVDPWEAMDKYGVDTLRLWMYSVNQPGESKNFDERTVSLLQQQVFGLLYNVFAFYELYRDKELEKDDRPKSNNILDIWILARLDELINLTTKSLDNYKLLEPTRALRDFIGDLSTWYLRRSRERIKEGDSKAKRTLYFILKTLAKLMAPFAPLAAEDVWLKLKNEKDEESVHLAEWPTQPFKLFLFGKSKVIEKMETARKIVTLGLEARQKAGIKVRQPLAKLEVKNLDLENDFIDLIKDEINVKEVAENKNVETEVALDINITEELKQEGDYRELARALQEMRKKMGLTPSDVVTLTFETDEVGKKLIQKFESEMKKTVLASKIKFSARGGSAFDGKNTEGEEIKINELIFKVKIDK